MLDNMNDYDLDPELCECTRLISNTFVINSAGISPATRQREQRIRGQQRRMNTAPQLINFDLKCDSPDKENNLTEEDISFYSSTNTASSPRPCPISPCRDDVSLLSPGTSPSIFMIDNNERFKRLNSHDSSSRDSGYSGLQQDISNNRLSNTSSTSSSVFQFVQPKLPETSSPSAHKTPPKFSSISNLGTSGGSRNFAAFHSLSSGSGDSIDDDYMELMDMESMDGDVQMPNDLCSLICKDIKSSKTPDNKRPESFVRKCLNMDGGVKTSLFSSPTTPKSSTITSLITTPERQCLSTISENIVPFGHRSATTGAFKRPEPPSMSPSQCKRYKSENDPPPPTLLVPFLNPQLQQKRPIFRKSMSMNDAVIHDALVKSSSESNLIGDFTQSYVLPLIAGRHNDLKSITSDTLRKLIGGEYDECVSSYKVIDCRYPYEYEGGHIKGALNLYTHEQVLEELVQNKTEMPVDGNKRNILIFHCEFSSERGPKLSRFLRNHDRGLNTYPSLHYPEVYLLHGGYKEFFETSSDLCDPIAYRPMNEPSFTNELRVFRAKSKSWIGDVRATTFNRQKSRSRLVL